MNDQYLVFFLSKTKKAMQSFIAIELQKEGITDIVPSHGNIFSVLYAYNGKLSMKEIAQKVGKDKSTITSHIKHLEKAGYVKKEVSEDDKRMSYIVFTQKGWDLQPTFNKISKSIREKAYENLSSEEKEVFLEGLKQVYMNFKQ